MGVCSMRRSPARGGMGKADQGTTARRLCGQHLRCQLARQPAQAPVRRLRLSLDRRPQAHRPQARAVRQRHLRHHPPQTPQNRCPRHHEPPAHQDRHGLGLPIPERLRLGSRLSAMIGTLKKADRTTQSPPRGGSLGHGRGKRRPAPCGQDMQVPPPHLAAAAQPRVTARRSAANETKKSPQSEPRGEISELVGKAMPTNFLMHIARTHFPEMLSDTAIARSSGVAAPVANRKARDSHCSSDSDIETVDDHGISDNFGTTSMKPRRRLGIRHRRCACAQVRK